MNPIALTPVPTAASTLIALFSGFPITLRMPSRVLFIASSFSTTFSTPASPASSHYSAVRDRRQRCLPGPPFAGEVGRLLSAPSRVAAWRSRNTGPRSGHFDKLNDRSTSPAGKPGSGVRVFALCAKTKPKPRSGLGSPMRNRSAVPAQSSWFRRGREVR